MKLILSVILLSFSLSSLAQKKLSVIYASSKNAVINEENNSITRWGINPNAKPDTYTTNKFKKSKTVKFKTDIDSITIRLKPGQKKDFIVIINGKDSCITRIQAPAPKNLSRSQSISPDTIPFLVNKYNTNLLKIFFNRTDSLQMNFDSGATEMSLTADVLKSKVQSKPKLYNTLYDIKIGQHIFKSKIYDTQAVGHEADGLLGWDLFDGLVVELNYDNNAMVIHSNLPPQIKHNPHYSGFDIHYINNRPFIECKIIQNKSSSKSLFLFDLGYQKTVMLDGDLLKANNFPSQNMEVINKTIMHGTNNNEIPVITAKLEKLEMGPFQLRNIPAQLIAQNKPMRGINIHILGNEVLKRFNTFFDFQNDVIYLMPNKSYDNSYTDQKKS
jgi:hypothetical protein